MVSVALSYSGGVADNHVIEMYDAAHGLSGFQRMLALTTHLMLTGEIITQAPSLRGAQILITTPEASSWKAVALISGAWAVATASTDTLPGHLLLSAYDYVINETLGFHPSYDKSLGEQYEAHLAKLKITQEKMDSLLEKTEASVAEMHRPIVASKTATKAKLTGYDNAGSPRRIGSEFNALTYDFVKTTEREKAYVTLVGTVSSFNINTGKGRIFAYDEQRPIPFELEESARGRGNLILLTSSLRANAARREPRAGTVTLVAQRIVSSTGRLKALSVTRVVEGSQDDIDEGL